MQFFIRNREKWRELMLIHMENPTPLDPPQKMHHHGPLQMKT
jgi:hypothetical protein